MEKYLMMAGIAVLAIPLGILALLAILGLIGSIFSPEIREIVFKETEGDKERRIKAAKRRHEELFSTIHADRPDNIHHDEFYKN